MDALSSFPDSYDLQNLLSQAYLKRGDISEALRYATKAVEIEPNSAEGYLQVGAVLFKAERYDKAEEYYRLGFKYDPDNIKCQRKTENFTATKTKHQIRSCFSKFFM